jgi:hypothetical protein
MKVSRVAVLTLCISLITIFFPSCKKSSELTSPSIAVHVNMEIISYQDAPSAVDSTLCYVKEFENWNNISSSRALLDTTRADSLAQWFAKSPYQITDMWFPNIDSRCSIPIKTENIVTLKLASPDTTLRSMGYSRTKTVVGVCYPIYRHYIFSRSSRTTP